MVARRACLRQAPVQEGCRENDIAAKWSRRGEFSGRGGVGGEGRLPGLRITHTYRSCVVNHVDGCWPRKKAVFRRVGKESLVWIYAQNKAQDESMLWKGCPKGYASSPHVRKASCKHTFKNSRKTPPPSMPASGSPYALETSRYKNTVQRKSQFPQRPHHTTHSPLHFRRSSEW
jgi:hypothetical protein